MTTRIIASVTVSTPVASVSVQAQGAATVRLADGTFTSSVTRVVPVANIKWINIQLAAEVDFRGLNPVVKDISVVLDDVGLHLFKTAFDTSATLDEESFVFLRKTPDEPLFAVEQHGYHLDRGLSDLVDATDDFYGTSNIDDDQVMFLSKSLQPDGFGVSDTLEGWDFGKNSVDPVVTQDVINSFDTTKQLDDTPVATEQHGYHLERSVSDVADAGDEINALFQTDDGEVMFLAKSLPIDRQTASDAVDAVDFDKASSDVATTAETTVADIEKAESDQAVSSDAHIAAIDKSLSDSGTSSEYAQALVEKPLTDSFGKDDAEVLDFGKARSDSANAADQLQPFVLGKSASDDATTSDSDVVDFSKVASDTWTYTDSAAVYTEKPLSDANRWTLDGPNLWENYTVPDYFLGGYVGTGGPAIDFYKPFAVENQYAFDAVNVLTIWKRDFDEAQSAVDVRYTDLTKVRADGSTTSDESDYSFGKSLSEDPATAEQQLFDVSKVVADAVDATDDILAEANSDDDQVMQFAKNRTDVVNPTDDYVFATAKAVSDNGATADDKLLDFVTARSDAFSTGDAQVSAVGKPLADQAAGSDSHVTAFAKASSETSSTTDNHTSVYGLSKQDGATSTDSAGLFSSKSLADVLSNSDIVVAGFGKQSTDNASTGESKSFYITKQLADLADVTDDFDGTATSEDDQTMSFTTGRTDLTTTQDSLGAVIAKELADPASTGDSGSLRMTDYCDVLYFTEVYTGTSLTF